MKTSNWYQRSVKQTEEELHTSAADGLSRKAARAMMNRLGKNVIFPIPGGSFSSYLKQVLSDFTSILLLVTALLAVLFDMQVGAAVILSMLAVHYVLAVLVYVRAQHVLEDMGHHALPGVKVMRDGKLFVGKQDLLVPGDLIFLSVGDIVPADCRLVFTENLTVLEGKLTGESRSVYKDAEYISYTEVPVERQANMVFASTIVTGGTGRAIVCETGENTLVCRMGKNRPLVSHGKLRVISQFRKYCSVWSMCMIALVFLLTVLDLILGFNNRGLFDIFLTGLTLASASMSEMYAAFGYIVIATGIFAATRQNKEINEGALIKNSVTLEKIKDLDCLIFPRESLILSCDCSVNRMYYNGELYAPSDAVFARRCAPLLRYAVLASGIYGARALAAKNDRFENIYTPQEEAVLTLASKHGIYNVKLEKEYPLLEHIGIGSRSQFDTTIVAGSASNLIIVQGDARSLIERCRYINENGRPFPLTGERLNTLLRTVSRLSKETLRVIAIATRSTSNVNLSRLNSSQSDLTFEGLVAFREPLLPAAALNLSKCRAAGIRTILMCDSTSEINQSTADALGIATEPSQILDGRTMSQMKEGMFRVNLHAYRLFVGLSPSQKEHVLQCLQEDGCRVGVICRQLNEAKLARMADVSFAQSMTAVHHNGLGASVPVYVKDDKYGTRTGCEAIQYLSDVVLAEPSAKGNGGINAMLDSIGSAKVIYLNLLRMARYLITSQIAKFLLVLYGIVANAPLLTPVQVLFAGIITDFAAVVTIAFEPPSRRILSAKVETAQKLHHPFTANASYFLLGILWAASCAVLHILPSSVTHLFDLTQFAAATFYGFLISQIIVLLEVKKEDSLFSGDITLNSILSFLLLGVAAFITLCQLSTGFGSAFGTVALSARQMLTVCIQPVFMLIVCEITKLISRLGQMRNSPEGIAERQQKHENRLQRRRERRQTREQRRAGRPSMFPDFSDEDEEPELDASVSPAPEHEAESVETQDLQPLPEQQEIYIDPDAYARAEREGMDPDDARATAEMIITEYGNDGTQEMPAQTTDAANHDKEN